jgi:cytochrome c oxidase subunit 1
MCHESSGTALTETIGVGKGTATLADFAIAQAIFVVNFFYSIFFGPKVGRNPWNANTLEWMAPSPPGHGNFDFQPVIYRGPYEYGSPEVDVDYYPQTAPPPSRRAA